MKKNPILKHLRKPLKWAALAIFCIIALSRGVSYIAGAYSCSSEWKESGMDYKYKLSAGCMISPNGNWIPARNYRID